MRGTHDRHGNITIALNSQSEALAAPPAPDGSPQTYLPCDACGQLEAVPRGVVSTRCSQPWDGVITLYSAKDRDDCRTFAIVACQLGHELLHRPHEVAEGSRCCNTFGCRCSHDHIEADRYEWRVVIDHDLIIKYWPVPGDLDTLLLDVR